MKETTSLPHTPAPVHAPAEGTDYERLAQEILRQLRGSLSQRQLSERLGYSYNQVGKWESGVTRIKWDDMIQLAEALALPMEKRFRHLIWNMEGEFNVANTLRALEKYQALTSSPEAFEPRQLKRWFSGESEPDFSGILKAFDLRPGMLISWLASFTDCTGLMPIRKRYEDYLVRLESIFEEPVCTYVNSALHLRCYQELAVHDDKLLAEHAACSIPRMRRALQILVSHGLVSFDGKKYRPSGADFSFSGVRNPKLRALTKYTAELTASRYPDKPITIDPERTRNISQSSVRIVDMSAEASRKVADLIMKFHHEVGQNVAEDRAPKDNVQIITIHSFASNINPPEDT